MNTTLLSPRTKSLTDRQQANVLNLGTAKVWVCLPAFNEAVGLPPLLEKIHDVMATDRREYEVIVVDDASTDDTAQVVSQASFQMPIRLVQHEMNQGLSGAMRTLFNEVQKLANPGDVIITLDADNTQQPATFDRMLLMLGEGYDVVVASRYQPGSRVIGVPRDRLIMTWGARHLFRMIMPIPGIRDYTCGFRAYRFDALDQAMQLYGNEFVSEKGFSCMVDVLLKMRRFNLVMGEVPMLLRYDLKHGPSKMEVGRTAYKTLKLLFKRRFEK